MTLVKHDYRMGDPFTQMDRFFDKSFWESDFWPGFFSAANQAGLRGSFPANIYGDDEAYYLVAELPGVKKEDIDVKLENAVLAITAKRLAGKDEASSEYTMTRAITIGDDVNPDKVSAKLENGVLTVTLAKAEERKPKYIAIR